MWLLSAGGTHVQCTCTLPAIHHIFFLYLHRSMSVLLSYHNGVRVRACWSVQHQEATRTHAYRLCGSAQSPQRPTNAWLRSLHMFTNASLVRCPKFAQLLGTRLHLRLPSKSYGRAAERSEPHNTLTYKQTIKHTNTRTTYTHRCSHIRHRNTILR